MTTKTLKSYLEDGVRIQLVEVITLDKTVYHVLVNRRKVNKYTTYPEALVIFSNRVFCYIHQTKLVI